MLILEVKSPAHAKPSLVTTSQGAGLLHSSSHLPALGLLHILSKPGILGRFTQCPTSFPVHPLPAVARPSGFPLEGDTEGMSGSALSYVQYRAAAEGSSTLWSLSCQLCISPLSSSGLQPRGSPQQLHGHRLASLHGTGMAETLELQRDRTSVLGTPLGRGSRGWGSLPPLTSFVVGSFGLWLATGVQCPPSVAQV